MLQFQGGYEYIERYLLSSKQFSKFRTFVFNAGKDRNTF